ncbi:hypothetical protein HYW75_01590 [Candidatus Pacearchaeota archaeon]|nr:hypothetical protein [Candidatus Pacearchaeota archaeon]
MGNLLFVLLIITALFFIFLAVKQMFSEPIKKKFCVICSAVTITWIGLFILNRLGFFSDLVLLALLMGQTILGVFYIVESKVEERFKLFRLPFLLSEVLIAYFIINSSYNFTFEILFIMILWFFFWLIYLYRTKTGFNKLVNSIVDCCKKW